MTQNDLRHASFLDLLFENRNKQYGAYVLRKEYNLRLGVALAVGVASFFVISYGISGATENKNQNLYLPPIDDVIVRTQTIPPPPPEPPKPKLAVKAAAAPVAQKQFTQIRVVAAPVRADEVPAQSDLSQTAIAAVTTAGAGGNAVPNKESPIAAASEKAPTTPAAPAYAEPQFPGGVVAWAQFLSRNLQAPEELEAGEKKTVSVKFFVDVTGAVAGFDVVQSGGAAFDKEVLRVLRKMPKWKPALRAGQPVAVAFTQPVTFIAMGE